ncbi:hypothetical protein JCM10369A_18060 [Nocardioides pyridinolyticus]
MLQHLPHAPLLDRGIDLLRHDMHPSNSKGCGIKPGALHISDAIYRQLVADALRDESADPGGHCGASLTSSAADSHPHIDTSDQPLPDPHQRRYAAPPRPRKSHDTSPLQSPG